MINLNNKININLKTAFTLLFITFVSACGQNESELSVRQAQQIHAGDECHLCGMLITNFPGPKGELYTKTSDKVKKFCSTRDMFSFLLDPEYQKQVKEVFVHDMSKSHWDKPDDSYFIDARKAWFVVGSNKTGAMGKTIASFSLKTDAEKFSQEFGGKVYPFKDIKMGML
ncbi:nitrous oxide reductase accessory protein NosL [Parashewanella spongiae]|uniref:Nitrous oxide reductase accessory protein NosL n=1 Tax=Parashewanella spongiae TaxID=342950 RepID=A0A3A6U356_9GAMM|nr:nitrous oxide reductase accessory protein NosL [Parashewanella spongiae]MCL1077924.1 nitrous oxide reductase accessory protein NosL [Parashewanella spongiae]RJY18455.1 nitrous oxide reductase accessory protein NosL [Parashewanella spongiae]